MKHLRPRGEHEQKRGFELNSVTRTSEHEHYSNHRESRHYICGANQEVDKLPNTVTTFLHSENIYSAFFTIQCKFINYEKGFFI